MSKQKYPQSQTASVTTDGNKVRKGRESYSNFHLHAKRSRKRQEAEARQASYDALSIEEKMKGAGAKELAKLQKKLAVSSKK